MSDLVAFLQARLEDAKRTIIDYRDHRDRGDHVNYEGQGLGDYDPYDSCSRCIATSKAMTYGDVTFGLADIGGETADHRGPQPVRR